MTPKKHFFAYSYLVVGFPVSSAGLTGRMVSTGPEATRRAWFHIEAEDYPRTRERPSRPPRQAGHLPGIPGACRVSARLPLPLPLPRSLRPAANTTAR